jgi:RNA polymerase sigma-70 factor (ECF subfamily)
MPDPHSIPEPELGRALIAAIANRYAESGAEGYGITPERFQQIIAAVVLRYAADASGMERRQLVASLRVEELALARACSAGNEAAWDVFLQRFRSPLYATACKITRDETAGHALADGLYAELYGLPNREGRRISKLDYYMGRGSLEGWLRTVLAQQHTNRCRSHVRNVSLGEQIEAGVSFAARPQSATPIVDQRIAAAIVQTLAEVSSEERFLLASYYLDQRTLASIGRQLGVHESTISRKLERITDALRKRMRKRMQSAGIAPRRCDELIQEIDVRDLDLNVTKNLRQERSIETF